MSGEFWSAESDLAGLTCQFLPFILLRRSGNRSGCLSLSIVTVVSSILGSRQSKYKMSRTREGGSRNSRTVRKAESLFVDRVSG